MGKKALSQSVKNFKKLRAEEHKLTQAVDAFNDAKQGYTSKKRTYDDVAAEFGVDASTLCRRVQGKGKSMLEFIATKQKLTVPEEKALVKFILESAEIGFPLNHRQIEKHANVILQSKQGPEYKPVRKQWVFNFFHRHHDALGTHWSKSLDTQRAQSLNPAAVKSWYDILEEFVVNAGIAPENVYGMDESGFPTAYGGKEKVIGARGTKTQHKQGGADRENVTAVITICADGSTVRPLLIFKGKKMNKSWFNNNVSDA